MRYEHAIKLKASLMQQDLPRAVSAASRRLRNDKAIKPSAILPASRFPQRYPFALGVIGRGRAYRLSVRIQSVYPGIEDALAIVRRRCGTDLDIELIGDVNKQVPWHQRRNRPLRIGGSVGHYQISAGTLGCFVTDRSTGREMVLSNNHVLANENSARRGDPIIQPGPADGGKRGPDLIGSLTRFVRLRSSGNLVDAACAELADGIEYHHNWLESLGEINGIRSDPIFEGETVYKAGRTTGITEGRIGATELDGLVVGFDQGNISFDSQIQIKVEGDKPFSQGGDSGSLIVDADRRAVALLFAGNGVDSTFASPIATVLDKLKIGLMA